MNRSSLLMFLLATGAALLAVGCGGTGPSGGPDQGAEEPCTTDDTCRNANACDGLERCAPLDPTADTRGCVAGTPVECTAPGTCSMTSGACVSPCDRDSDGVESIACGGADCDDEDANRFPGNPERCTIALTGALDPLTQLHDEDCDASTLGDDLDEDSFYGQECANPQTGGALLYGQDCDDDNDLRRPGLVEVCDGLDNDCVGGLNFPGEDDDGDGYADCVDLAGQANFDCNDGEAAVNPGVSVELCDRLDANCDGYMEDADNDGFAAVGAACVGGPMPALDCDDDNEFVHPDANEICNGVDDNCSGSADDNGALSSCPAIARHGDPVCAGACDVACDPGYADCDASANSGCETDVLRSVHHCGACGVTCSFGCDAGTCLRAVSVEAGVGRACAVLENGALHCWGVQYDANAQSPVMAPSLDGSTPDRRVDRVAIGTNSTCVLLETGAVQCWGAGTDGQLGNGLSGAGVAAAAPTTVTGLDGTGSLATDVAVGATHACAALEDGGVLCWGRDTAGALGDGDNGEAVQATPVSVVGLGGAGPRAVAVVVGAVSSCALTDTQAVLCWGEAGRVGDGTVQRRHVPTPVVGLDGVGSSVVQIRATSFAPTGLDFCARLDSGAVRCWGGSPVAAPGLDGVVASALDVAVGTNHRCVVSSSGAVLCWGSDNVGQLGDGNDDQGTEATPVPALTLDGAQASALQVATGPGYTCALRADGQVMCWGQDGLGQLGNGPALGNTFEPMMVDQGHAVVALSVSDLNACIALDTGAAYCWGQDGSGQLGDGADDNAHEHAPIQVVGLDGAANRAIEVVIAAQHACALLATGAVQCWGDGVSGKLGVGTNDPTMHAVPVGVAGIDGLTGRAVQIALGEAHTCALMDTGAVRCWGADFSGMVGDPGPHVQARFVPVTVSGLDGSAGRARAISAGGRATCALLESGALVCWGENATGHLGHDSMNPSEATPVAVVGLDGVAARVTQVSVGGLHACARLDTGEVRCWGWDGFGQLGDGDDDEADELSPVSVVGFDGVSTRVSFVSAGGLHSCAALESGALRCWGSNEEGRLGTGDPDALVRHTPAAVVGFDGLAGSAYTVASGGGGSCAISNTQQLFCWGPDQAGQVGDGDDDENPEFTPVRVSLP